MADDEATQTSPFKPGMLVWVKKRSWLPGQIVDVDSNATATRRYMGAHREDNYIVSTFSPFNDVVVVKTMQLAELGESELDRTLMMQSPIIKESYLSALAVLNGDG